MDKIDISKIGHFSSLKTNDLLQLLLASQLAELRRRHIDEDLREEKSEVRDYTTTIQEFLEDSEKAIDALWEYLHELNPY